VPEPQTFQTPPGTFDVLPPESATYEQLVALFAQGVERAGYGLIISPMFEEIGVFQRVGESTDVVRKEMYDFYDKGGRHIALRPEGTASVVRAWVQHRPPVPWKVWYVGPSFRYEHAQAGRYRQHHQLGIEALGSEDPFVDVEVIALLAGYFAALGLQQVTLKLNSLGDETCRPAYRAELEAFLAAAAAKGELCEEHMDRYRDNPLRILDCKRPDCVSATAAAPQQVDRLCAPCTAHFQAVRHGLDAVGVAYVLEPRLVRGLDYYTRTTFEFASDALASAQNALGGGGRYDGLAAELGGPPTPGIGFGTGIERIRLAAEAEGVELASGRSVDVFVVDTTGGMAALELTHELRAAGISADRAFDARSFKAQFKAADRSGATVAVIVGGDEAARAVVGIKPLRGGGDQHEVARPGVIHDVRKMLSR
jgi:histidyl-tRNA synthetase